MSNQRNEIIWNLINAGLAGALVFVGAFADGSISWNGICAAIAAALVVTITKFKDYWSTQESEYTTGIFNFI